ncbi:MAG: lysyl-tRNA synthetase, class, partial [Frankiaceae bacterium]|nr:lysyl-tRNA synthetase, class [Frankiaceae bacterium]
MAVTTEDRRRRLGGGEAFATLVGRVVSLAAVVSVVAFLGRRAGWIRRVDDVLGVLNLPYGPSLVNVVVLVLLASALRRRLRVAWAALLGLQVLGIVVGLLFLTRRDVIDVIDDIRHVSTYDRFLTVASIVIGIAAAGGLLLARRMFPARVQKASRLPAALVLTGGLALSAIIALGLTEAFPHSLAPGSPRVRWALRAVIGVVGAGGAGGADAGRRGTWWVGTIAGVVSAGAVIAATVVFLRSARAKHFLSEQDELA